MKNQFMAAVGPTALLLFAVAPLFPLNNAEAQSAANPDSGATTNANAAPQGALTRFNTKLKSDARGFSNPDKVYTVEEIRNAKPLPWTPAPPADKSKNRGFETLTPGSGGEPQSGPSAKPDAAADLDAQLEFAEQWRLIQQVAELEKQGLLPEDTTSAISGSSKKAFETGGTGFGTADIYTGYPGNYWTSTWTTYPHRAIGKLLIDGGGYCTAQVISPKNIIVTAAHCVYNGGSWNTGWTFVPAERYGSAPYGQFRWTRADVLPGWQSSGNRRNDVALIQLANNSAGRSVTYYTGWLGWRMNYPYIRSLHSFGYASNISTQYTSVCAAESFYASSEGTDVLNKGCNMTYGSSGGAWIDLYRPFQSGAMNYVESVVSGPSTAGAFGQTYVGPRFSSANFGTLCNRYGGC